MVTCVVFTTAFPDNTAVAQEQPAETDSEARGLFQAGRAAFDGGRFEEALGYFERAYELSGRAQMLYNIGHAAERIRNDERALEAFEEYLQRVPDTDSRASIEARIEVLREQLSRAQQAEEDAPVVVAPTPVPEVSEPESRPIGGLVLMIAGGAAIAGGALGLGLAAKSANTVNDAEDGTSWSSVRDDAQAADRRRVAGAITGAFGVALLAAGAVWHVNSSVDVEARATGVAVRGSF